jgi:hypothetical protein
MIDYIKRHWRGELSLPRSYWVNGVLIGLPFNLYFRAIGAMFEANPPQSPSVYLSWFLLPLMATFPLLIWQGVGVWRSAGKRIEAGNGGWAWAARIVVLLNALIIGLWFAGSAKMNYSMIVASSEERAAHYTVEDHGDFVMFGGDITDASANELAPLLQKPKMEILIVNGSVGGFIQPALRLAKIIHERNIWVVALGECDSSCTGLLAAGKPRSIEPDTITGFHYGTKVGLNEAAEGWSDVETYYLSAGMSQELLAKTRQHRGPYDFYQPPLRELIETGFITSVYDAAGKRYVPAREWCAANTKQCDNTGRQNADAEKSGDKHE